MQIRCGRHILEYPASRTMRPLFLITYLAQVCCHSNRRWSKISQSLFLENPRGSGAFLGTRAPGEGWVWSNPWDCRQLQMYHWPVPFQGGSVRTPLPLMEFAFFGIRKHLKTRALTISLCSNPEFSQLGTWALEQSLVLSVLC